MRIRVRIRKLYDTGAPRGAFMKIVLRAQRVCSTWNIFSRAFSQKSILRRAKKSRARRKNFSASAGAFFADAHESRRGANMFHVEHICPFGAGRFSSKNHSLRISRLCGFVFDLIQNRTLNGRRAPATAAPRSDRPASGSTACPDRGAGCAAGRRDGTAGAAASSAPRAKVRESGRATR